MTTKTKMAELEMIKRGEMLAEVLRLKRDGEHKDRYTTKWGTKTALGLFLTVERIINEGE